GGRALVELRAVGRAGVCVAADADLGRLAGPASGGRGRRGGARWPEKFLPDVGRVPCPLPPRRGRGRGAGLVHCPAGELGAGPFLSGLPLAPPADDSSLRPDRGLGPPPPWRP